MRKILILLLVVFAVVLHAEEPVKQAWEAAPGILSGSYDPASNTAVIYKAFTTVVSPSSLPFVYYAEEGTVNQRNVFISDHSLGYGSFLVGHEEYPIAGETGFSGIKEADDNSFVVRFSAYTWTWKSNEQSYPLDGQCIAYIYKAETVQPMEIAFPSESYTAEAGQKLSVNIFVIGGSGSYAGTTVKPTFLTAVGKLAYEGSCNSPLVTSISVVVKDKVTGQECAASADITITEKTDDPNDNPSNPNNPSDPSDPSDPSNPSDPSDPNNPTDPTEPSDPSNPDSPDEPSDPNAPDEPDFPNDPTEPEEPTEPDSPDEPEDPSSPDGPTDPSEPDDPSTPDSPDEPSDPDEPVVIIPDPTIPDEPVVVPDEPDEPDNPEASDEPVVVVPNPELTDPGSNDNDEPIVVVINDDSEDSDTDKIIVTDDGVTTVRKDNYDLAIFLGMFGAITGLTGSAAAPSNAPIEVQQSRQESRQNKINYVE